jgi:hypothetical protein
MSTAAAKVQPEAAAPAVNAIDPGVPEVKPAQVRVNSADQLWRSLLVRMPKDSVADDLRTPAIWRLVQASPFSALRALDRLFVLAHDESWAAEAICKTADNKSASLAITKVFAFAGVGEGLFSDGTYKVGWSGHAFDVIRISDDVPVSTGFGSEGTAIDALRKLHPRKVG